MVPPLNQDVFAETNLRRLAAIAADFGAALQPRSFDGPESRSLWGLYVNDRTALRRQLICVNMANHPVAVAAAFWHEIGYHLTREIFDGHHERLNLKFAVNY
jgi:hypothetical protein